MKIYFIILLLLIYNKTYSQDFNLLGLDSNLVLTKYESDYFNNSFQKERKSFDFTNKKIGFFTGTEGQHLITKRDYFDSIKDRLDRQYDNLSYDQLVILNEAEKIKSGGFDAVIFLGLNL
ncbi:MAG: hypothetical protein IPH62_00130 [Ignavibacteriae bacterium]|nr:hypothetical protein [Ignavibacteriota bacterium]